MASTFKVCHKRSNGFYHIHCNYSIPARLIAEAKIDINAGSYYATLMPFQCHLCFLSFGAKEFGEVVSSN